jgi:hypothetical protein
VAKLLLRFLLTMPSDAAKKSQDVGDEVLLRRQESVPIRGVSREVDLLGGPKRRFGLLVHPPDVIVLDGEEDKMMGICLEKWFGSKMSFGLGGLVL